MRDYYVTLSYMSITSAPITPDTTPASGASDYIVKAFRYYLENNAYENNERQQALSIKNISRKLTLHTWNGIIVYPKQ